LAGSDQRVNNGNPNKL